MMIRQDDVELLRKEQRALHRFTSAVVQSAMQRLRMWRDRRRWDDYTRSQMRLRYRKALRYGQIAALILAGFSVILSVGMVLGCAISDLHIARHYATTYARVESVDRTSTYITFTDRNGVVVNPQRGVLYPTGVREGQNIRIDYDDTNPQFARISGRNWTLSILPALSVLAIVLPWCALLFAVLGRYRLRAGGRIRRTHFYGTIAGIHVNLKPTIMSLRAATAPPSKQVI